MIYIFNRSLWLLLGEQTIGGKGGAGTAIRRHWGGPAGGDLHQVVTEGWSEMSDLGYIWRVALTGLAWL